MKMIPGFMYVSDLSNLVFQSADLDSTFEARRAVR
jgi:hypothetical protein